VRLAALVLTALTWVNGAGAQPSWDWQLDEPFDLSRPKSIMNLDAENHSARQIAALKARGVFTICYLSVGTVEDWRPDRGVFPAAVIGKRLGNWPGERYVDIRRRDILLPIMAARMDKCRAKGFDAIEPDNMDVFDNDSGFALSANDAVAYVRALAQIAHRKGLRIGQKNVPGLTGHLIRSMDFVIVEDCYDQGWCQYVLPYAQAGKPVLAAEYTDTGVDFAAACRWGQGKGISFILKDRDLTSWLRTC